MIYWSTMTEEVIKCRVEEDTDEGDDVGVVAAEHG
jgi:hypothetical protein